MPRPSWQLDRRTFLRSAGLSLALPWLEAMSQANAPAPRPKRFCAFFFGNGVALPPSNRAELQEWHWFPHEDGPNYKLTRSLEPLEPHRRDMTPHLVSTCSPDAGSRIATLSARPGLPS